MNNCYLEKDCIFTKLTHSDIYKALMKLTITDDNTDKSTKRRKRIQKIQKEFNSKCKLKEKPAKEQEIFSYYNQRKQFFTGSPYRYSVQKTFHMWYSIRR